MHIALIFAILLFIISILLLLHHAYKHSSDAPDSLPHMESCIECCYFQPSDISNHETWILICITNAITIIIMHTICQHDSIK